MNKVSLTELLAQREQLEKQIAETQSAERNDAVAQIRSLMQQYGLTLADIGSKSGGTPRRARGSGAKVAAKYRNPARFANHCRRCSPKPSTMQIRGTARTFSCCGSARTYRSCSFAKK